MRTSRFIVGLILVSAAALLYLFGGGNTATAGAVALAVLGLAAITISRRR
jgi:hypothetical protein